MSETLTARLDRERSPRGSARWSGVRLLAGLCAWLWVSSAAAVDAPVPGQVLIVLASSEGSGVDPALEKLEALKKAPFDGFSKKSLLKRVEVQLEPGKDAEVELPNGRKLRITLLEKTGEGRYRVSVSINRPGKQDYLPVLTVAAAAGDPFFVAGQKYEGGTLVIGVSVGKAG